MPCRRSSHRRLLTSAVLVCLGLGVAPAAASASAASRADATALAAYRTYLNASIASLDNASQSASAVVSTVQQNCPNALSALNNITATKKVQAAATAYGHELDADLTLVWLAPLKPALNRFAATLSDLHWGSTAATQTATRLISAERTLINLHQSNLCENAFRLAGHPATTPAPTNTFLTRYNADHAALVSAENAFGALLRKDAPGSGPTATLLSTDQSLESQYASASSSDEQNIANSVLSALGFS